MLTFIQELRTKGGLGEDMREDLAEGMRAASSILHRANDAIDKEHRLEAVSELQSRVEDWKGHKIDHFGELLLHGNFTVLKGEGAKEVEREVGKFFDSLPPRFYAILLDAVKHEQPMLGPPCPQSDKSTCMPPGMWAPPGHALTPKRLSTALDSVPEQVTEEERGPKTSLSADMQALGQGPEKQRSMPVFLKKMGFGSKLPLNSFPNSGSRARMSIAYSHDGFGAELGFDPLSLSRRSKLKLQGVLFEFGTTIKFKHFDSCLKFNMRSPMIHHLYDDMSPKELEHLERTANKMGIRAPVSAQYKVYLFERILLCCKEMNPNKPKNKMLGNNKPLVDKKGKPRLQLKGRIFMQNVTDVMSFIDKGL